MTTKTTPLPGELRDVRQENAVFISAPEWFDRDDFIEWLTKEDQRPATWHPPEQYQKTDFSDVMTWVEVNGDHIEGSDYPMGMPDDVADAIHDVLTSRGLDHAIVWIKPV